MMIRNIINVTSNMTENQEDEYEEYDYEEEIEDRHYFY